MRITVVTSYFVPAAAYGGPARSILNLCRGLVAAGDEVTVLTTDAAGEGQNVSVPRYRVEQGVSVETRTRWFGRLPVLERFTVSPGLAHAVPRAVRRADVVLVQGLWTYPSWLGSLAALVGRTPYVLSPRGALEAQSLSEKALKKRLAYSLLQGPFVRRAAALHFTSERERLQSGTAGTDERAFVVENGFVFDSPPPKRRARGEEGSAIRIGIVGRIHRRKGFDVLLPALADTPESIRLDVIGPDEAGYRSEVERMARSFSLERRLRFTGLLEGEALDRAYRSLDYLVVPSHGESFGNTVIESLAQGTPVIVTPRVPLSEMVRRQDSGMVIDNTTEAWRQSLRELMERPRRWDHKGLATRVRAEYDHRAKGRQMHDALASLLAARPD